MKTSTLKSRNGAAVDKVTIETFRREFHGQALLPGDAGYDPARRLWSASIDKRPGLIARCSEAADVVRAVKFSRANNLLVAVKSGGHNVAGQALCDDGIVIDLSAMNGVSVNPELHTVRSCPRSPSNGNPSYRSSQTSSMRQPLYWLLTMMVSPLSCGCMQVAERVW